MSKHQDEILTIFSLLDARKIEEMIDSSTQTESVSVIFHLCFSSKVWRAEQVVLKSSATFIIKIYYVATTQKRERDDSNAK